MEEYMIRSGDAGFGFAAVFLFGIFTASSGWDADIIFLCLCALGVGTLFYFPNLRTKLCGTLIAFAIFVFPLSIFYYHLRVPMASKAPSFAAFATINPLFAYAIAVFERTLPERQASLIAGIISGSTTALAPDVKLAMSQSGTSYIIGIYGYKIYFLAEAVRSLGKKFFSRRMTSLLAIVVVASFIAIANAPISALRAGIMTALAILAETTGRKFNARIALMFTAACMIFFDPTVMASGGFLLSFMSLVGIYALAPSLKELLQINGKEGNNGGGDGMFGWKSHLVTTIAVNLTIMPIASVMYGDFPAISFVSNFLIALPFGAIIGLGIVLAVMGNLFTTAIAMITPVLNFLLSYQLLIVKIFSRASWSIPALFSSPVVLGIYYAALAWYALRFAPSAHTKNLSKQSP